MDGTVDSLLLPVLPLLGPVVTGAILLLPRYPFLDLLAAEEQHLAGLVVGNAGAIDPAADEVHLRIPGNHGPHFENVDPVLSGAEGAVQDGLRLQCEPVVDGLQLLDDPAQDFGKST